MTWQAAGTCLLCGEDALEQRTSQVQHLVTVRCRRCGSSWTGDLRRAEDVQAAASALDRPPGGHHDGGSTQARAGALQHDETSSVREER
jgi:hypothetical protein